MTYVSRLGISIVEHSYAGNNKTEVEKYIQASNLLTKHPTLIKMDVMSENSDDSRIIQGIKTLIS
jgi:hypothetical protein